MKNRFHSEAGVVKGLFLILAIAFTVGVAAISLYSYAVSVRNAALAWETDLNKIVRVEVSERATYELTFYEQTGLGNLKSEKMDAIIRNAIEGRYGDNPNQGTALLQAVSEAYPDTTPLNIYDKILPTISAGREAIRNKQNLRIEKAQAYNYWRKEGIVRAWILSGIYPSRDLHFRVGSTDYYAVDALEKMAEPISTATVNKSFETGIEKPLAPPK
ncbi:MAG: hypothetical protein Q7S09_03975 [bacterium]|nr:hypothetical protein [bacterium]